MRRELEAIQKRRGLYLGNSTRPFTSLLGFLTGYQCGHAAAKYNHATPDELVPEGFSKFVVEKFGGEFPSGKGWSAFIEENTSSEEDAFNLFFTLREEFDKQFKGK